MKIYNSLFPRLSPQHQALLSKLERQRKLLSLKTLAWLLLLPVSLIIGAGLVFLTNLFGEPVIGAMIGFLLFIVAAMLIHFKFPDADDMNNEYRRTILPLLVRDTLPGWQSASEHRLSLTEIVGTGLFRDRANQVVQEDYFAGPAGNATAKIYEVIIRHRGLRRLPRARGSPGGYEAEVTNRFYGYFFFLSPLPAFSSRCWIFPRERKARGETDDWAKITGEAFAAMEYQHVVATGNPGFDETFIVFSENPSATKSFLTDSILKNISDAHTLFPGNCAFSFTGSRLYVMAGFSHDPLDVVKGLRITGELELDHRTELLKMRDFVETLSRRQPFR